jgi:hypothetical protein
VCLCVVGQCHLHFAVALCCACCILLFSKAISASCQGRATTLDPFDTVLVMTSPVARVYVKARFTQARCDAKTMTHSRTVT